MKIEAQIPGLGGMLRFGEHLKYRPLYKVFAPDVIQEYGEVIPDFVRQLQANLTHSDYLTHIGWFAKGSHSSIMMDRNRNSDSFSQRLNIHTKSLTDHHIPVTPHALFAKFNPAFTEGCGSEQMHALRFTTPITGLREANGEVIMRGMNNEPDGAIVDVSLAEYMTIIPHEMQKSYELMIYGYFHSIQLFGRLEFINEKPSYAALLAILRVYDNRVGERAFNTGEQYYIWQRGISKQPDSKIHQAPRLTHQL